MQQAKRHGKWTSVNALDMGVPAPTVAEAVFARCLSAVKEERIAAEGILKGPEAQSFTGDKAEFIEAVREALLLKDLFIRSRLPTHAEAQNEYDWKLNFGEIARFSVVVHHSCASFRRLQKLRGRSRSGRLAPRSIFQ